MNRRHLNWVACGIALVVACVSAEVSAAPVERFMARVTHVTDGDTIWVQVESADAPRKLRLLGIDAPEICQAGGEASRAALQALLAQRSTGLGVFIEVALSDGAAWAAMPRTWGMTLPGTTLGGGHAGYRVYTCLDGRVALAALEPHFAKRMALAAGLDEQDPSVMENPETVAHLRTYFSQLTRAQLNQLATEKDIPLYTMP